MNLRRKKGGSILVEISEGAANDVVINDEFLIDGGGHESSEAELINAPGNSTLRQIFDSQKLSHLYVPSKFPECLDRISWRRRGRAAGEFGPAGSMLNDKTMGRLGRIAVHAIEILARRFSVGQAPQLGLVINLGDLTNLQ